MLEPESPPGRINCLCPACRRTTKASNEIGEWICAKHWQMVDHALRKRYLKARRRCRKDLRWHSVTARLWVRCKDQAIFRTFTGG